MPPEVERGWTIGTAVGREARPEALARAGVQRWGAGLWYTGVMVVARASAAGGRGGWRLRARDDWRVGAWGRGWRLKREERWQDGSGNSKLTHTGNMLLHYRDLDGNGSATGTNEFNDTRAYSDANELLTRDTDSSGGTADYTLVYDAVGNEIDDGIYKKTYDPIGRLTTVKNQSNALVASYTYNAYGYLTTRHYDINLANGVTSADPKICYLYDEDWCLAGSVRYDSTLALNAGKNEPFAEMFLYHTAGLGGYGTSSKLDAVLMRAGHDPANWGGEAEQAFGYFIYMMDDWRGDVVFVVKANGQVLEWVSYSAFGTPFLKVKGDVYSDGNVTVDDITRGYVDWWGQGIFDARADINADGDVDGDDYALLESGFWGHEVLSDVGNRFGYAGYQHTSELAGAMYLARNRFYNATTGRFPTRDQHPTPYVDGMNLYQYVRGMPLVGVDPMGLAAATGGCAATVGVDFTSAGGRCHSGWPTSWWPGVKKAKRKLESCFECLAALREVARDTSFSQDQCHGCCDNYVCKECPTDPTIPANGNKGICWDQCIACCADYRCIHINRLWRELPECIECASGVDDDYFEKHWPSEIAKCRKDRFGGDMICKADTWAKLLRCQSREAWNGCPPIPVFTKNSTE